MLKEQEVREIIRKLRKEGWEVQTGKGSHLVFRKDGKTVSVPTSSKEVKLRTYRAIAKGAGWL